MKKTNISKVLLVIASIACSLSLLACSSTIEPEYDDNKNPVYISNAEKDNIYADADPYAGKFIEVVGKVFNIKNGGESTTIQIWADYKNYDKSTMLEYNGKIDFENDDYVKVTGYILGNQQFENKMGGTLVNPLIEAQTIEKLSYKDAVVPTIKEVTYDDKEIDQYGYKLKITKVEFAEEETRIYVTATNNGEDNFDISTYSAVAIQNGKQFDQSSNYEADYPQLNSEIRPGIVSEGVIVFPTMEQSDFTFVIEAYNFDFDKQMEDYNFTLEVK